MPLLAPASASVACACRNHYVAHAVAENGSFERAGEPTPSGEPNVPRVDERHAASIGERRERIVEVAMRQFADRGYRGARVEDVAHEAGISKGSVFGAFGSKEGLFLAAYKRAVSVLPAWLDASEEVLEQGFWATFEWWLERSEEFASADPVPNRVALIGRYDTGLGMRRPINRFMRSEDPYGTLEFVEFGVERGEVRGDVDVEMVASMLDWVAERFQDALVAEDLDPGLIHRTPHVPERRSARILEVTQLLRAGIGDDGDSAAEDPERP